MDLRTRILASYDEGRHTREDVARRYRVSLGMVKKLLAQRRATGDIAPLHHRSGRKPKIVAAHHRQMRKLLAHKPDLTLAELREAVALPCWRSVVGMFSDDELMKQVDEEGRRWREEENRRSLS